MFWTGLRNLYTGRSARLTDDTDPVPAYRQRSCVCPPPNTFAATTVPSQITLDIVSPPENMTATVDGQAAVFPLSLARDGRPHELVFRAPGHRELRRTIEATRDQALVLAMERVEPQPAVQEATPPHHHHEAAPHAPAAKGKTRDGAGATATNASAPAGGEKPQPKTTSTPARRLPAAITDVD